MKNWPGKKSRAVIFLPDTGWSGINGVVRFKREYLAADLRGWLSTPSSLREPLVRVFRGLSQVTFNFALHARYCRLNFKLIIDEIKDRRRSELSKDIPILVSLPSSPEYLGPKEARLQRRRLLFVVNDATFFISHRLPIAVAALEAGYHVAVAAPMHPDAKQKLESNGIRFLELAIARKQAPVKEELRILMAIWKLVSTFQPDVVHLITAKPIIFGGLICRLRGVPVLAAISGLGHAFAFNDLKSRLLRFGLVIGYGIALKRRRAMAIFQNADNLAVFKTASIIDDRYVMIRGSGANLTEFAPGPPLHGDLRVLMPARMLWTKGVGEFVAAAKLLRSRGRLARFILAGNNDPGNPASISLNQLRDWSRGGAVEWIGYQTNISECMRQSDVVVLPSYYPEGLPKSLIDASAAGRPIVTTDVPGCRDAIVDGVTGLLCTPNDPEDLAEKIDILLNDTSRRIKMGEAARNLAEREFAIENVVAQHLKCYAALLSDPA